MSSVAETSSSSEAPVAAASAKTLSVAFFALHVFLPILLGGLTYIAWRSTDLWMFDWAWYIGLTGPIEALRVYTLPSRPFVPDWFLFSFPDGTWVYASTAFFARLWPDGWWPVRWSWISLGAVLAIGGELGQIVGLVPGTFDVVDVLWYSAAFGLAYWLAIGAPVPWNLQQKPKIPGGVK